VLAHTTDRAQASLVWDSRLGFGLPEAAAAARRMLGTVATGIVRNRVTPLFRMHSVAGKDYADITSPQLALALALDATTGYQTEGSAVPGYDAWGQVSLPSGWPVPKAPTYVLTTEHSPNPAWPPLLPLWLMDKPRNQPSGCEEALWDCTRDFLLATTTADIHDAHAAGYNLRNIQGYIYSRCPTGGTCIVPPGAQKFYRACNTTDDDCATFLQSDKPVFDAAQYTNAFPGSETWIGYAYPSIDTDGDGLIDGFEYVIGTRHELPDTDGDNTAKPHDKWDGDEFPMVGVALSDPCSGGTYGASRCPADIIFTNAFD
jgi:hypothetical protein